MVYPGFFGVSKLYNLGLTVVTVAFVVINPEIRVIVDSDITGFAQLILWTHIAASICSVEGNRATRE